MNKEKIEALTKTALDFIEKSNYNKLQADETKKFEFEIASDENYKAFLATFEKLKDAVETQSKFDHLTNLRNQAHFKMKRHQYAENLLEHAKYQSEVDLYEKLIEQLKSK